MWIYGWKPAMVSHHFAVFDNHWSTANGDIKYLTCHVISQNHMIEVSSNLMSGSSWWYSYHHLAKFGVIGIVVAEI